MKYFISLTLLVLSNSLNAADFYRQQCGEDFITKINFSNGVVWIQKKPTNAIAHYIDKATIKHKIISYKIDFDKEMTEGFIHFFYSKTPSIIFAFNKAEASNPYELCANYENIKNIPVFLDIPTESVENNTLPITE